MGSVVSTLVAALIAGLVSLAVTTVTTRATARSTSMQVLQAQFAEIIKKRVEMYPNLWRIHIYYETNWTFDGKPKTREWAQEYVEALNDFNLDGGLYFSEDLYSRFVELRGALYEAIDRTGSGEVVPPLDAQTIRGIVYGGSGRAGLATHLKDDLGSYNFTSLQRRASG